MSLPRVTPPMGSSDFLEMVRRLEAAGGKGTAKTKSGGGKLDPSRPPRRGGGSFSSLAPLASPRPSPRLARLSASATSVVPPRPTSPETCLKSPAPRTRASMYAWGWNGAGQCGYLRSDAEALTEPHPFPGVPIDGFAVCQAAASAFHTIALSADGGVFSWGGEHPGGRDGGGGGSSSGSNSGSGSGSGRVPGTGGDGGGSVGDGDETGTVCVCLDGTANGMEHHLPRTIALPRRATGIACGAYHALAMDDTGRAWAWGSNAQGQLGIGIREIDENEDRRRGGGERGVVGGRGNFPSRASREQRILFAQDPRRIEGITGTT